MNAEYVETIKNKIINNPGELVDEELSFIGIIPELMELFAREVVKQDAAAIAEEATYIIGEKLVSIIPEEIREDFWTMALGYGSGASLSLNPEEFESFTDMLKINPTTSIEKYKERVFKTLQDPNLKLSKYVHLTEGGIRFLLDQKRYDLFEQVNQIPDHTISKKVYNRFINEYPDKNKSFLFLTDYKFNNQLYDELTIEELIFYRDFLNNNKKDACFNLIIDKLNQADDLSNLSLDINWTNIIHDYSYKYDYDKYIEFISELYQKGCLVNLSILISRTNHSKEQIKEDILNIIKSKKASRKYLDSIIGFKEYIYISNEYEEFKKDKDIIRCLAENDYLDVVFNNFESEAILANIDIIRDAIIQKKSTTYLENIDNYLNSLPLSILELIIDNNDIKTVDCLFLPPKEELEDLIIKIIDKNIKIDSISFADKKEVSDRINLKLIEKGYYHLIINNSYLITDKKYRKYIIEGIKKDPMFAFEIPSKYLRFVLENDDILDVYLNAIEPIIDSLIDKLNHNEELNDLYNQHLFNKFKQYFCKKYNYEQDKLELVERHFGPTIIRFIDNENIAKIIKLPKEDIEKIIRLFPKVEYTMDDIKASYESLVQYAFAKNKQKEHGLFATLMHAIQDNDQSKINECKMALLNTIDYDMYKKLRKKYNLQQITLAEYFDYTVEQIINGNDKEENINSIHNIANEYVSLERKRYHNNHFFDRTYPDYANLYENIVRAIDENNHDFLNWTFQVIIKKNLTEDFYKAFAVNHEISDRLRDPETLMRTIFEKIAIPEKREKYLTILKFITNYCYEKKKSSKSKFLEFGQELGLPYSLDGNSLGKAIERELIVGRFNSYYIIENNEKRYVVDLIAERLIPQGIDEDLIKDIIYDIENPDVDILNNRIYRKYNALNGIFNSLIMELYKSGEIPFSDWQEAHNRLNTTQLKTKHISLYDYLKQKMPEFEDYLLYVENPAKGEENFKNKYRKIIPLIIKTGKEIIKGKEVYEAFGYSIKDAIIRSYISDRQHIFFRIDGQDIPMAKILYDVLKDKVEMESKSLFDYLFLTNEYHIPTPSDEDFALILETVRELTSKYSVIYDNKEETTYDRDILKKIINNRQVNRAYVPDKTEMDPYEILANLNLELLKRNVLDNEEMYLILLKVMENKKIHLYPESISRLLSSLDIDMSLDASNIAAFISYFPSVLEEERKRYLRAGKEIPEEIPFTTATILAGAEVFGTASSVYAQILGKEDAKLIKANPKENQATLKLADNGRLKEAISLTLECFQRQEITVPPFAKEFKTESGKKLRAVCGNFTHPCNLTHGERTGACMRIGGAGESLFYFALRNKNGFHIRFENPDNGEYVSRVSGFRNGNTVFLNELRYSCSSNYSNGDVVDICTQVAQELIDLSKDSPCPIENVVITKYYAMSQSEKQTTKLNIKNVKEGLGSFYSDVDNTAVVLATTAEEEFAPVDLDKSRVPTYPTLRGAIKEVKTEAKMVSIMNRVLSVNELLSGTSYEDISAYTIEDGFLYGLASEDWFIYVNEQLEIKYGIISIDPRAQIELQEALSRVKTMVDENKITNEESVGYGI